MTLPNILSALIGSALLSFTVSFDEIPVTFFLTGRDNTLPMYIYSTLRRGNQKKSEVTQRDTDSSEKLCFLPAPFVMVTASLE